MNYRLYSTGYIRPSYWHETSTEPLFPLTIGQLADWAAEQWGDCEAIVSVYENVRISFKEARNKAEILAAGLLELGLEPGDRLGIWGYNSSIYFLTVLAAAKAGLILARIIPGNEAPEILHCLNKVEAKALIAAETITGQNYYDTLRSIAPEIYDSEPGKLSSKQLPNLKTVIFAGETNYPGALLLSDVYKLASSERLNQIKKLKNIIQPENGAAIHYTSGTTGHPKGVLQNHFSLVNNSYTSGIILEMDKQKYKILAQLQLCHTATNLLVLLPCLHFGSTMVLPSPKYDPEASIKVVQEEKCNVIMGAPGMYINTLSLLQEQRGGVLDYPQIAIVTGAPCSTQLETKIKEHLPIKEFINLFGMTEVNLVAMNRIGEQDQTSTVGRVVPHVEVKVVDKEGYMVPFETPGELYVRGYNVMRGYWNDDEKTKETITSDNWLKTGDLASLDKNGSIKIVGRIKDAIIRESVNVFPSETEEFFLTHEGVLEVQAFGVPDIRYGEEMCVYIVPKNGVELTVEELFKYCHGKLADYRIPRYIRFVKDFPRTAVGKTDKRALMSDFKKNDEEFITRNLKNKFY